MYSRPSSVEYITAVFGVAGRGKSTVLNHLLQSPADAKRAPHFLSKTGGGSCTLQVSQPVSGTIYGTNQRITVYDTPGSFSVDIPLEPWFELLKARLPNPFHCLIWVLDVEQRAQPGDMVLSQALEKIFDNFKMDKIIIVFTHCDRAVEEVINIQELAQDWMKLLNSKIKNKVDTKNIVLFGKAINGYDNSQFIPSFVKALEDIPQEAALGVKSQIDKHAVMNDILSSVDENLAKKFQEEQKKLEEDFITKLKDKDEMIAWLKSQPVKEIHHYTERIIETGGGGCNLF